jgi:AcrR family transcriptional regulator
MDACVKNEHTSSCNENTMTRTYTLKRRAEQQAQTRRRIVDAAVDLHASVGPAQTTVSMVARRAGVQRHTVYAHFPDEWSLSLACSGQVLERDPLPDAKGWLAIADASDRLAAGLDAVYRWYERNADLAACVLRDGEHHAPTKRINELRMEPAFGAWCDVLGESRTQGQCAMVRLALSYFTWRSLARESGLDRLAAVEAMVRAVEASPAG